MSSEIRGNPYSRVHETTTSVNRKSAELAKYNTNNSMAIRYDIQHGRTQEKPVTAHFCTARHSLDQLLVVVAAKALRRVSML